MTRMTGGQAIVRSLKQYGVDTIFGLPGLQLDHFFNALYDEGNSIRAIQPRHEQGAAYMAYGYALSSGKVGTFAVVPGPGLLVFAGRAQNQLDAAGIKPVLVEEQELVGTLGVQPGLGEIQPALRPDRLAGGGGGEVPPQVLIVEEHLALAQTGRVQPERHIR